MRGQKLIYTVTQGIYQTWNTFAYLGYWSEKKAAIWGGKKGRLWMEYSKERVPTHHLRRRSKGKKFRKLVADQLGNTQKVKWDLRTCRR